MIKRASDASHFGEVARKWEEVVVEWASHISSEVTENTAKRYMTSLDAVLPYLSGKDIAKIGRADISAIVEGRKRDTRKKKRGASTATIKRDLTAVSSVLRFACDHDWREGNPALDRMKRLKESRDPIRLPTEESIKFLLARCEPEWVSLIKAARYTGARLDELRNIQRGDLNLTARTLFIQKAKRNKPRTIDLSEIAADTLRQITPSLSTKHLFHHGGGPFADISSGFRSKVRWAHVAAQKSGSEFTPFRFHDLRHLYAVEALKSGMSIYDVQQNLGHASIKMTEAYLAYLSPDEQKTAKAGSAQKVSQ